ncbi:hypothetical protein SteCoe_27839 [Stentor coeruleus]|uniref:Uncharacterized protein n=1 Tax=Stentor coeruleus TaxID=5963 RepID=A0A1R2B9N2_9CILI|nr:hypothetical protein SteCoe_27839 [Stentor coeruleus]
MSIQNARSKSFLLKPMSNKVFSISKLKPKNYKGQDSDIINSSMTIIKANSAQPCTLNASLSPSIGKFSFTTQLLQLSELESRLFFNNDQESSEKVTSSLAVIDELILIFPDLSTLLSKIKETFEEHIGVLNNRCEALEKNMCNNSEDFKRLKKRYKKLALESLDIQAQIKDRRMRAFELKKEKNKLSEELLKKNDEHIKLNEKIKRMEKELHHCLHKLSMGGNMKELSIQIPIRTNMKFDIDSQLSPIGPNFEFTPSPGGPEECFSPLYLQVPN